MSHQNVKITDQFGKILANAQVKETDDCWQGTFSFNNFTPEILSVFEEWEEIVNGQMLSFLDEIQQKISRLSILAVFEDGRTFWTRDLQIYPSTSEISFKTLEVPRAPVSTLLNIAHPKEVV
jgi:hypothetical protein